VIKVKPNPKENQMEGPLRSLKEIVEKPIKFPTTLYYSKYEIVLEIES
jgi:hypothetical protein